MNLTAIDQLVHTDRNPVNLQNQYTNYQIPERYYNEIKTSYTTSPLLLANRITYRLGLRAPAAQLPDYCPNQIGDHPVLVDFVMGLINNELTNSTFEINFSPSFIILTANQAQFDYQSDLVQC